MLKCLRHRLYIEYVHVGARKSPRLATGQKEAGVKQRFETKLSDVGERERGPRMCILVSFYALDISESLRMCVGMMERLRCRYAHIINVCDVVRWTVGGMGEGRPGERLG